MTNCRSFKLLTGLLAAAFWILPGTAAVSQTPIPIPKPVSPTMDEAEADLLSDDELEVLVAPIALYPDELVAAISSASLFPLQIVEAERFLKSKEKNSDLKPKKEWDGSVVSLLNYPDIVEMMSDDLDWTQSLAEALTTQQKDVLIAIQQLRDEAVAKDIIKTDDKVTVVTENENVIIRPTDPQKVYIPQYPPEMLYAEDYQPAPISYYPDYYESYYYPGATFFAGAVTGAAWAAVVNWDDWGVWGGDWDGDVDIDCNDCFKNRDFNGKVKLNDIDWNNVDRSKLNVGKDQLAKLDRSTIKNSLQADNRNQLKNKAAAERSGRGVTAQGARPRAEDIRKSTVEGLKSRPKPQANNAANRPNADRAKTRPSQAANRPNTKPAAGAKKKSGSKKMAARPQNQPRQKNALGNVQSGRREAVASNRGRHSMGGGQRGAPRVAQHHSRPIPRGGGGRGGGGRR